jgi:hypothetical protein
MHLESKIKTSLPNLVGVIRNLPQRIKNGGTLILKLITKELQPIFPDTSHSDRNAFGKNDNQSKILSIMFLRILHGVLI